MSKDKTFQSSDTTEQVVWDQVVNVIYKLAQMAQKLRFNKYKLDIQLETNVMNNHRNTINELENIIINLTKEFHKYYKTELQLINQLYKTYSNKPRIMLMLDTTKDKLQNLLAFNELKEPTLTALQSKINSIQQEPTKADEITPNQSKN